MNQYLQIPFDFFNHPFFVIFGGVSASIILLGLVYRIIFWVLGITPIVIRLGVGLWRRKIDNYFFLTVFFLAVFGLVALLMSSNAAWAAARRAIGTRYGEHET